MIGLLLEMDRILRPEVLVLRLNQVRVSHFLPVATVLIFY